METFYSVHLTLESSRELLTVLAPRAAPSRDSGEVGLGWGLHTHGLERLPGAADVQPGLETMAAWADSGVICLR